MTESRLLSVFLSYRKKIQRLKKKKEGASEEDAD